MWICLHAQRYITGGVGGAGGTPVSGTKPDKYGELAIYGYII